jgi:hypothetical protein
MATTLLKAIKVVTIIALLIVGVSEAHLLSPGSSRMPRKIDRSIMLREMQVKIFHYYQSRMMLGAATQRLSPGGPDSQHH